MALEAAHDPKVPADPYDDDDFALNINSVRVTPLLTIQAFGLPVKETG